MRGCKAGQPLVTEDGGWQCGHCASLGGSRDRRERVEDDWVRERMRVAMGDLVGVGSKIERG